MKALILVLFIVTGVQAAPLCEVYGISDSPQALHCRFAGDKLDLSCRNGIYILGTEVVEGAYHLEVEEGPTPLVFRTKTGEMTVVLESGRQHPAELARGRKKLNGKCSLP